MKPDISITIAGIKLKTPVLAASGTFGYGYETGDLVPLAKLGAIVTKTITREPRPGNAPPRLAEVSSGIINTIGLQNVGFDAFLKEKWPELKKLNVPVIVSIAGGTVEEYGYLAKKLDSAKGIAALELNLSCPNLQKRIICQDSGMVKEIIRKVTGAVRLPVIAKLSPQVADIGGLAILCEESGADALSLVNTFPAMAIDIRSGKPKLSTVAGGLSGPAIKPMALRCVWEVCRRVNVPVIGGGGIMSGEDAVEFILAGARAVSVGTANFIDPGAPIKIAEGIRKYLASKRLKSVNEIIGKLS